jgi:hypothetical protein
MTKSIKVSKSCEDVLMSDVESEKQRKTGKGNLGIDQKGEAKKAS